MKKPKETSDLIGQREQRIQHMRELQELGIDPFPAQANRTHENLEITKSFAELENKEVTVVGRITSWRSHGKIAFADISDKSGSIQLYIKSDELAETKTQGNNIGFEHISLLDQGDFIQASGKVTRTERGEISVLPTSISLLAKSIRPLPVELSDKEERYRRRYVDMAINSDIRQRFIRRAKFWQAHRDFFNKRGFHEVNIPVLEHIPGGGDAVPFLTHMNAINEDFFLRISHELPLKRLIGGGFEKVYDIGARFRNEGLSDEHLPEHVAMEFYWAYADWRDGMKFIKELFQHIVKTMYEGKTSFQIREFTVDFSGEWDEIDFNEIMKERFGFTDIYSVTLQEVLEKLKEQGIDFDHENITVPRGVDMLWKQIRKTIAGPAFLINHPRYLSPLQKSNPQNPDMVERFQPIIAGSELGNGWTEVNDPIDQYDRFMEQQKMRDQGDDEAQWLDIDYVEMLEYGMPPTFGYGHSERVFWFFENVTAREGVPFPQLKYHVSDVTRELYSEVDFDTIKRSIENNQIVQTKLKDLTSIQELSIVSIDEDVQKDFTGIKTGYIVVEGISVNKKVSELENLKKQVSQIVKNRYNSVQELKDDINIDGFRSIYKTTGIDPNSRLNSAEALMRRLVKGKGLYNINNVVDTYNVTSAEYSIPMAAYDLDKVNGGITLRYAIDGDTIRKIGDSQEIDISPGEIVYADDAGVICLDYNYRDSERTKITDDTQKAIFFVDGHSNISSEYIQTVLSVLASRIEDFTGGRVIGKGIVLKEDKEETTHKTNTSNENITNLPSREEAELLLEEHVQDEYQRLHAKMVALAMESYAQEFGQDKDLWYITGLLHDIDYEKHPDEHPQVALQWFKEWGYPEVLIHAVDAHYVGHGPKPESKLAAALIACDELSGFLYAYSLMRPNKFSDMKAKGAKKRLKDKAFAAKINREDIAFGVEHLGVDMSEHITKLITVFKEMPELSNN